MGAMTKSSHSAELKTVCAHLRAARSRAALTQRELAIRLNVSHSWVAKVETGERRIDLVEVVWFLMACDLDPHLELQELVRALTCRRTSRGGRQK